MFGKILNLFFGSKEKPNIVSPSAKFVFSQRSKINLASVNPRLSQVANLAITFSEIDFGISEGKRTFERQRKLMADGKTQTLKSKHLTGEAIDVLAYVNGKVSWEHDDYIIIANALQKAAKTLDIDIRWGGAWNQDFNGMLTPHEMNQRYISYKRNLNQIPFLDMVHFELI